MLYTYIIILLLYVSNNKIPLKFEKCMLFSYELTFIYNKHIVLNKNSNTNIMV